MGIKIAEDILAKHKQAMYFAQDAVVARNTGKEVEALYLFKSACDLELEILYKLKSSETNLETLGVILRSAATLAVHCQNQTLALQIIGEFQSIEFSDEIREELDKIVTDIRLAEAERQRMNISTTILIVSNNVAMRSLLKQTLKDGSDLIVFDDAEPIKDYFEKHPFPGVILIDLNEQNELLDGTIALINKYHLRQKVRIVALLSKRYQNDSFEAIHGEYIDQLLEKPFNPIELSEKLLGLTSSTSSKRKYRVIDYSLNIPKGISPLKRSIDIVVSFVALLLLAPFLLVIIAAILIESKGPALYIAKRTGKDL